jgi:magnesium chelatase family protein
VADARTRQQQRYECDGIRTNAELTPRLTSAHCDIDAAGLRLLESAIRRMSLSARGFDRVRKVARTIADLAAADRIRAEHIAEALQFRME